LPEPPRLANNGAVSGRVNCIIVTSRTGQGNKIGGCSSFGYQPIEYRSPIAWSVGHGCFTKSLAAEWQHDSPAETNRSSFSA
jgi:hypothetical protein